MTEDIIWGTTAGPILGSDKASSPSSADAVPPTTPAPMEGKNKTIADRGVFLMFSGFNATAAKEVVTWILESNFATKRDYDHLTLVINSPGGAVSSAFAIIDAINGSAIPVHTVGLGMIASCGLLTFMAGAKGHRTLTPNTSILSHQWAWGSFGKEHELFAVAKEYDLTTQRMMAHYKKCTDLTDAMIREKLLPAHDVWLSAEEAKTLNVCDHIKLMGS